MDTANSRPTTVEGYAAQSLHRRVLSIADRLDDLAATVRRAADGIALTGTSPGHTQYAQVTQRVVHEVITTLANLQLGSLSTTAAEADIARTKGE